MPDYDDTGHIEFQFLPEVEGRKTLAVKDEVYVVTGQRPILFVKGVRYNHTESQRMQARQIYTEVA